MIQRIRRKGVVLEAAMRPCGHVHYLTDICHGPGPVGSLRGTYMRAIGAVPLTQAIVPKIDTRASLHMANRQSKP